MKIVVYILIYYDFEIIKRHLQFIQRLYLKYSFLEIIIIENKSINTPKIRKLINFYINNGVVKKYYYFSKNISNNAIELILIKEKKYLKNFDYIIITDGDLLPNNYYFIDEMLNIINIELRVMGVAMSLDYRNLPIETMPESVLWKNIDYNITDKYIEGKAGMWFMLFKKKYLLELINYKFKNNIKFVDSNIYNYADFKGYKILKTKNSKAIHLTWYRYHDLSNPYTKFKINNIKTIWHHNQYCIKAKLIKPNENKNIYFYKILFMKMFFIIKIKIMRIINKLKFRVFKKIYIYLKFL